MSTKLKSFMPEIVPQEAQETAAPGPIFDEADYKSLIRYCAWLLLKYRHWLHQGLTDAHELAQEALMRCLRSGRFDNAPIPLSYVKVAAKNVLRNLLRDFHPVTSLTQLIDEEKENGYTESKLITDLSWKIYRNDQYLESQKELLDELIPIVEKALKKFDYTDAQLLRFLLQGYSVKDIANEKKWVLETFKEDLPPEIAEKFIRPRLTLLRRNLIYRVKQIRRQMTHGDNDGDDGGTTPRPRRNRQKNEQVKEFRYSLVKTADPDKKGGTQYEKDREYALSVSWSDDVWWEMMCKAYRQYLQTHAGRQVSEQKETCTRKPHSDIDSDTTASGVADGALLMFTPKIYPDKADEMRSDDSWPSYRDSDQKIDERRCDELNSGYEICVVGHGAVGHTLAALLETEAVNVEQEAAVPVEMTEMEFLWHIMRLWELSFFNIHVAERPEDNGEDCEQCLFIDQAWKTIIRAEVKEKSYFDILADVIARATTLSHDRRGDGISDFVAAAWPSHPLTIGTPFGVVSHTYCNDHNPETPAEHLGTDKLVRRFPSRGFVRIRYDEARTRPPESKVERHASKGAGNLHYPLLYFSGHGNCINSTIINIARAKGEASPVTPRGMTEEAVAWVQTGCVERVNIYDDFFDTGGRLVHVALHNGAAVRTEVAEGAVILFEAVPSAGQTHHAAESGGEILLMRNCAPAYWHRGFPKQPARWNPVSTAVSAVLLSSNVNKQREAKVEHPIIDYQRLPARFLLHTAFGGERSARPLLFMELRKGWIAGKLEPVGNPIWCADVVGYGYYDYKAVRAGNFKPEARENKASRRLYVTGNPCRCGPQKQALFEAHSLRLETSDLKAALFNHCVRLRSKYAETNQPRGLPELRDSFCSQSASFHSAVIC